jgi:O-antigen ligase
MTGESIHRKSTATRLTLLDLPLALFTLSAVFGLWPAYDRSLCRNTLITLVAGFGLYLVISRLANTRRRWRAIAALLSLTGIPLALYFVTQYTYLDYDEKVPVIGHLGTLIGGLMPRIGSWTPTANSVATFLEGVLFLTVALALTQNRRGPRIAWGSGAALMGLALLMSASRGAWLAVALTAGLWLALYWKPARFAAGAVAVFVLALIAYVLIRGDILVLNTIPVVNRTLAPLFIRPDRLEVYRNSLYLIQDCPFTGIGLGPQFAMVHSWYTMLIRYIYLTYSHNLYLEVWLQQGLLGISAVLWLMAALYTGGAPRADLRLQSTWLGLTAIFMHGLTDARQYVDLWCWLPFFGLLGLNAALRLDQTPATPAWRRALLPAGVVGAFLVIVGVSLGSLPAAWEANRGCIFQARGDLLESLDDGQRAAVRRQAVDHYRRAIRLAPQQRTANQRLGVMLMDAQQFAAAVPPLEAAWQANPDNTTTHKALGLAYVWVGELEKARPLLQNVPDIVNELNVWGWWRGTQGQTEQSLNAYRMSLLLKSDQPQIRQAVEDLEQKATP